MKAAEFRSRWLKLQLLLKRAGPAWPAAAISLLLALTIWGGVGLRAYDIWNVANRQASPIAASDRQTAVDPRTVAQQNLANFRGLLGEPSAQERHLAVFFRMAKERELELEQGEYRVQADPNAEIQRVQVQFPLKAGYPAMRRYCESVLTELPFVSLDDLSFKRDSVGEEVLEVKLRFSLYLKPVKAVVAAGGQS